MNNALIDPAITLFWGFVALTVISPTPTESVPVMRSPTASFMVSSWIGEDSAS